MMINTRYLSSSKLYIYLIVIQHYSCWKKMSIFHQPEKYYTRSLIIKSSPLIRLEFKYFN